ncbi:MAG: DUF4105 domain-containing protein [Spirosomaceae bacterium]|nr:DUF4105 domain-containing protein [Spirosomataceae bacterium]
MQIARIFLILQLLFPLWGLGGFSYAQSLTSTAKISLITVSPGKELYSSFGHSALWVSDPVQGIDKVYNYGTFDFRTEGFYLKFLRGTLPYQLSVSPMYYTMYGAQAENRSVTEQVLNLSTAQRQRLYDFLENNYLPQNRQYAYKFYYDNCSTRLRDALRAACGDSLRFSTKSVSPNGTSKSYRHWMNDYLGEKSWATFGMNLAIGLPANEQASIDGEMYLPNNLRDHFDKAVVGGKPLVSQKSLLFVPTVLAAESNFGQWLLDFLISPMFVFSMIGLLLFGLYFKKKPLFWFDKLLLGALGIAGWILFLLWVGTDHGVTAWNLNLLWALPLHVPLFFTFLKNKAKLSNYLKICVLMILILGLGVGIAQYFIGWANNLLPDGLVIFLLGLMIRYTVIGKIRA